MARRSLFVGVFLLVFSAMCGAAVYFVGRAGGAENAAKPVFSMLALISGIPGVVVLIGSSQDGPAPMNASSPYQDPNVASIAPPCNHSRVEETVLKGGAGPDEAAASCRCLDCHAHRWRYCDDTVSVWRPNR